MDLTLKIEQQKGDVLRVALTDKDIIKLLYTLPSEDKLKILDIISFDSSKLNKKTLKLFNAFLIPPDKIISAKIPKTKFINAGDCH